MASGTNSKVFSFLSFIAVGLIGLALLLSWLFNGVGNVSYWLNQVAFFLSAIVVAYYSFFYATRVGQTRTSYIWHVLIWAASIVLIVIFWIMPIIKSL